MLRFKSCSPSEVASAKRHNAYVCGKRRAQERHKAGKDLVGNTVPLQQLTVYVESSFSGLRFATESTEDERSRVLLLQRICGENSAKCWQVLQWLTHASYLNVLQLPRPVLVVSLAVAASTRRKGGEAGTLKMSKCVKNPPKYTTSVAKLPCKRHQQKHNSLQKTPFGVMKNYQLLTNSRVETDSTNGASTPTFAWIGRYQAPNPSSASA